MIQASFPRSNTITFFSLDPVKHHHSPDLDTVKHHHPYK